MAEEKFHSGFVALVGRPNVGKSTLMNAVLGEKVSIVSAHAQTTRNKITGVWNGKNSQVVFLDTPGMHKPQSKLGQVIRQSTVDALDEVDVIVFICACDDPLGAGDRYILSLLKDKKVPVVLVLSKIELIKKDMLLKSFSYSMGIYYLLFIFMGVAFLFLAPWLLSLLKSNIILPDSGIMILYLIIILLELNHSFFATMIVIGNTVPFMGISLITGGLIALGSFLSLQFTGLGILGLVLVQGIVQLAYSNWKWPQVICKEFKISFITFLRLAFSEVYTKQKEYYYGRSKHRFFSNNR